MTSTHECIKCGKKFTHNPAEKTYFKHEIAPFCLQHQNDRQCDCIADTVKLYPYQDGMVVCYCNMCIDEKEHTCRKCNKVVELFSFADVCYNCDFDANPGIDDIICCSCHRKAEQQYNGDYYCDWCI